MVFGFFESRACILALRLAFWGAAALATIGFLIGADFGFLATAAGLGAGFGDDGLATGAFLVAGAGLGAVLATGLAAVAGLANAAGLAIAAGLTAGAGLAA